MEDQIQICTKYSAEYLACADNTILGLADNVNGVLMPINGLRHPQNSGSNGWYIWAGEQLSSDDDFFKPHHTEHLSERLPYIDKYLGLAPGWRFLIDPANGVEDVWYDSKLLEIDK